jgi:hypothetical protein
MAVTRRPGSLAKSLALFIGRELRESRQISTSVFATDLRGTTQISQFNAIRRTILENPVVVGNPRRSKRRVSENQRNPSSKKQERQAILRRTTVRRLVLG